MGSSSEYSSSSEEEEIEFSVTTVVSPPSTSTSNAASSTAPQAAPAPAPMPAVTEELSLEDAMAALMAASVSAPSEPALAATAAPTMMGGMVPPAMPRQAGYMESLENALRTTQSFREVPKKKKKKKNSVLVTHFFNKNKIMTFQEEQERQAQTRLLQRQVDAFDADVRRLTAEVEALEAERLAIFRGTVRRGR